MGLPEILRLLNITYGKDLEVVETLPLSFICKMIVDAKKKEALKEAYPLWLVQVLIARIQGQEILSIEEMFGFNKKETSERTAEEIQRDFMEIVNNHRKRGEQ